MFISLNIFVARISEGLSRLEDIDAQVPLSELQPIPMAELGDPVYDGEDDRINTGLDKDWSWRPDVSASKCCSMHIVNTGTCFTYVYCYCAAPCENMKCYEDHGNNIVLFILFILYKIFCVIQWSHAQPSATVTGKVVRVNGMPEAAQLSTPHKASAIHLPICTVAFKGIKHWLLYSYCTLPLIKYCILLHSRISHLPPLSLYSEMSLYQAVSHYLYKWQLLVFSLSFSGKSHIRIYLLL